MADETTTETPRPGTPLKGIADASWPICPNCQGYGTITQELAIAGKGLKGEPCASCNGVGRVPGTDWPACADLVGCPGEPGDPRCAAICGGLGTLSPGRQRLLEAGQLRVPCPDCEGEGSVALRPTRRPEPQA